MKYLIVYFLALISTSTIAQVYSYDSPTDVMKDDQKAKVGFRLIQDIAEELMESNFETLQENGSEALLQQLDLNTLLQSFESLARTYGNLETTKEFAFKITAENTFTLNEIFFGEQKFDLEIAVDDHQQITSLMLKPAAYKGEWTPPAYAAADYKKENLKIPGIELLAELVEPKTNADTSIVVMVHGSGPNDMDESTGPNKFFKDLALGLVSKGISSLRYNKRTFDYPSASAKMMNKITIDDIVTNDAVAAIEYARSKGYKRVILVGHSLGGHMAPKIAANATVDGVIIMAGNASPMVDLLVPQYEYLIQNDAETQITEFQLDAIKAQTTMVKEGNYNASTPAMMLPLGLPYSFWNSLKDYEPAAMAKSQKDTPYLILNGDRDYQVTAQEAKRWKNGSKNKLSNTIIYPKMNHLFYEGEGVLLPSEYFIESHVAEVVINDIANWIKAL